jgi:signal transduction histidine kinase
MERLRPVLTLRGRLALLHAATLTISLVVVFAALNAIVANVLIENTASRLELGAGLVDVRGNGAPRIEIAASEAVGLIGALGTAVAIVDADGDVIASEANGAEPWVVATTLPPTADAALARGETVREIVATPGGRVLVVAAPISLAGQGSTGQGPPGGSGPPGQVKKGSAFVAADEPANAVVRLAVPLDSVDAALADLRAVLVALGAIVLVVAIGVAFVLTGRGLRPLEKVVDASERLAAGKLDARAGLPAGDDEIGRLGRAFDTMAGRLETAFVAQRQFAAEATHELRSPLTIVGGYIDVLAQEEPAPESRRRILAAIRREIDRLARLASDLLLLTQLEASGGRLEPRRLDLGALIRDLAGAGRALLGDAGRLEIVADRTLPVVADADRLTQALLNLLDNATRHVSRGGLVRVTARGDESAAVIEVFNEGLPIPPDELPRIFGRFFRGTHSASDPAGERNGHAGLGLPIARAIVEASGGSVAVASDETGTRFTVRLPLAT